MATKKTKLLEISTTKGVKSFRRAGYGFSEQPVQLPVDDLTDEQIAALKAEPLLRVVETEAATTATAAAKPAAESAEPKAE
ncbi:HI1506-related protein [Oceanobacter kriegii]|uniref:HI1506-related protein n=1 Tax=Oceanobacter kriegii TaxID=64972 RepID=UPI0003F82352|nr:HI1506-related protein [Oceanobacter kriegii]